MQRPSPRFRSEEYFEYEVPEEMFYPNLQRFVWRRHAGAHPDGHQRGGRKPTATSVIEFCCKSVNSFFEELINIKVILCNTRTVQIAKFPDIILFFFFNLHGSSLSRHVNAALRKSLEIQAYSITKPRNLLKRKFV